MPSSERSPGGAERVFRGLGRFVVRHPWYPIIFWIVLLLVAAPFLSRVGSVTDNSSSSLPASAPSSIAAAQIAAAFPNASAGSDAIVLIEGPALENATGQAAVVGLDRTIGSDRDLTYVASVDSLYTTYASYLAGQAQIAAGAIHQSLATTPTAPESVNETAVLLWGVPALLLGNWVACETNHTAAGPHACSELAYNETYDFVNGSSASISVLRAVYEPGPNGPGFNNSTCLGGAVPLSANATACLDGQVVDELAPLVPQLFPPAAQGPANVSLHALGIENHTAWTSVRAASALLVAQASGLPAGFLDAVWENFPSATVSSSAANAWATGLVAGPLAEYPLPIPTAITQQFVSPDGQAEIVIVTFSVSSGFTDPNGTNPVASDVGTLDQIVPQTLGASGAGDAYSWYVTGGGALDTEENQVLSSSLAIVLPLTIIVLLGITIVYFRAPLAPLLTFGGLGIALGLGVGAVVLIGTLITHVDVTSIELEETFVLGVGTDYSIFLVSRYREELYRGVDRHEAVVTSVTWAGQSVATSGATAILATLALTVSGVALLSQWGMVLSLAIFITVMISLTIVPAFLTLLGGRVFWPATGAKFEKRAREAQDHIQTERTYFFRAGRLTQRRPLTIIAIVLLVSLPLIYLAINVPVSYDFYNQLPTTQPASAGLQQLDDHFGGGFAFPVQVLLAFREPLLVGNATNSAEFQDLGNLTSTFSRTSGVFTISSPVGPGDAPLGEWLNFSSQLPGTQANLRGTLSSFVGVDGRTVLISVVPAASGLSNAAVELTNTLENEAHAYQATHPELSASYFGGGAPTVGDLAAQTALATEHMLLYVSIGLLIVLFVALRSWMIPLLAVATIGLSLSWAWGLTNLVLRQLLGVPLFFFVPTILFIVILGLGIDYNIFLLTRVREERVKGASASEAVVRAVAATGGIITAAAIILGSAFAVLATAQFLILRAIGFAVAVAVILDAMVVRTYLVPSALQALGDRAWKLYPFQKRPPPAGPLSTEPSPDVPEPV
jgi:uncharacterized membrane protein YdfJ with MMPL/SSD domain